MKPSPASRSPRPAPARLAAFDQGTAPAIACLDLATTPFGDFDKLVSALQSFIDSHFAPVWGTPAKLAVTPGPDLPPGRWALVFLDDADAAGALGYHDLTPDGFPLGKVFVKTTIDAGDVVSVTASHELAEMLADPGAQLCATGPHDLIYAYEVADAVESESFAIDGIEMTNFVYPSWFESFWRAGSRKFDHLGTCRRPFQVRPRGYMPVFEPGRGWSQIFGSKAGEKHYARRPHGRPEIRKHGGPRKASKPKVAKVGKLIEAKAGKGRMA